MFPAVRRLVVAGLLLGVLFAVAWERSPRAASATDCGAAQREVRLPGTRHALEGSGPVLLELSGDHGARLSIAQSVADRLGWRGQKTPWLVRKSYRGPVVVTARRIDRRGQVRFAYVYGQHLRELDFSRDDRSPPVRGFYELPSDSLFHSSGCYAFRVTGKQFRERLVVRVVG